MNISFHIAGYEIVLAPAGLAVLTVCVLVLALGVTAIVRAVRRNSQT